METTKFPREILLSAKNPELNAITVVLGCFNGLEYLESMKNQLLSQETQDFHLIVIDNDSKDDSLSELSQWASTFPDRMTLVKNGFNLGGTGTIINNFDLISTPWFTSFHQDDFYGPSHVSTLLEGIRNASVGVIAISTVMASMSNEGKKIGTIPRASMFAGLSDPVSSFLQNLRTHAVPWPATAFKCTVYGKTFSSLHSSAFPDTEQILRMCAYGEFVTIDKETMYYRENAQSESHSIISAESELGTALAICRILNSPEFTLVVSKIQEDQISDFTYGLIDAINFRLQGSVVGGFAIYTAVESLITNLGYENRNLMSLASKMYENLGSELASGLLERIASHSSPEEPIKEIEVNELIDQLNKVLRRGSLNSGKSIGLISTSVSSNLFQKFPYRVKKNLIKIAVYHSQRLRKSQQFNFSWSNKEKKDE
jgi:glycosyltransferase involved in cell wall biosynthesis